MHAEVFAHKFFAPPAYDDAIQRQVLVQRVCDDAALRVVVVQAPAGHGKSTLLQQMKSATEAAGAATGWLTLDEADNDVRRLSAHLQALVAGLGGDDDAAADDIGGGVGRRRLTDWLINRLVRLERPVGLFLDEFQTLSRKEILAVFRELLARIPETVTIYIGSRAVPEIGLARLVVNHQALVLRAEDLRFSADEVQQFFAQTKGLQISRTEVETIHRRTEGWPAAVQLFRLSLGSSSVRRSLADIDSGRPRELAEYLADNVLALQPPRIQEFLLRTSVLSRLSAQLCDEINDWQDSQSVLLYLERSGLFLRGLDSDLRWFKYHTLFSSFLAEQLRTQDAAAVTETHQRAARWFHRHELFEEAMHHAVAARDYSFAADVMNQWASQLIPDGRLITVERWSDRLPLAEIERRPDLAVKIAWALTFLRRNQKLKPVIDIPDRQPQPGDIRKTTSSDVVRIMVAVAHDDILGSFEILKRVPLQQQAPQGLWAFELGAAANVAAYGAQIAGDFEVAREYLSLARAYGTSGSSSFAGGYTVALSGVSYLLQGRLAEGLERFRSGFAEQRPELDESLASGSLVSCYIWALYEADRLDAAEALFTQFHDAISDAVLLDFLAVAYVAMARTQHARSRGIRAQQILDECEEIGHAAGWPRLLRIASWERVRQALLDGDIDRAHAIASRIPQAREIELEDGWMTFSECIEAEHIGACRLALYERRIDEALQVITAQQSYAQTCGNIYRQLKLLVLEAQAHALHGTENLALRSLLKALQLAQPGGYVRVFVDEGEPLMRLLRSLHAGLTASDASTQTLRQFAEAVLHAAGHGVAQAQSTADSGYQPLEPLTEREKEMLVYLGNGVSNKEMAQKLFVSENTVKFHLKNIYSKLAVNSRLQAINAARQMGLL